MATMLALQLIDVLPVVSPGFACVLDDFLAVGIYETLNGRALLTRHEIPPFSYDL
jgi:hypothetical protein